MASNKADHVSGDQWESDLLLSTENKHYSIIDEKGDHSTNKLNSQDIMKKMIAKESEYSIAKLDSQSVTRTLSSTMSTEDNYDDSKIKSIEFSDSEVIFIDEDSNIQNKGCSIGDSISELPKIREYDSTIDERLPETVTLLTTPDGGKLYLVGTAHFSIESQNDVSKVIQAVQPHIVVVELCRARVGILQLDEETMFNYAKNIDYKTIMDIIKREGVYDGLLHILLLRMAAHVTKQLGMPPGGEFRRAFKEAKKVPNCIVHLADRPINITMQRTLRSLSWWQTIKLGWHLVVMKDPITQDDIEFCKQRSILDEMIAAMKEKFPVLEEVFVKERDIYLTNSLQIACQPHCTFNHVFEPARVVGIVGLGHTSGIIANWGKIKPTDIPPIMRIPPPSLSGKILKLTIKISILGATFYIGYKVMTVSVATLKFFKSSVEGLFQIDAAR
ncbi:traB domain-containing protein [Monomorium pharaonis]|uniref:traB domain-containing protein n=1 Tax=Monomorium pharaonis TaxID=307658 RepID=UPI00063F569B|nr:traB domain-containing protein [Monomorium pharaonis]XP_012536530.1 traB domain-containing protein [Monomorium pharaonis]XP_012536531.1 traB domain-containing protein [Monomorium pharaonis]XP_036149521.1 traB domain-containing protein [Monomorium pharaonis]